LLLPQRVKSNSDQGFALLSSGEKPCPLSLSHGFFTIQPSPSTRDKKMGTRPIFARERILPTCGQNTRKWGLTPVSYADAEKSEWRMALKI